MHYDSVTVEKLKQLDEAKKLAVSQNDFERAIKIKEAIEKLKTIGIQINQLMMKERAALERYEFAKASAIKEEIDVIRQAVINSRLQFEPTNWQSKIDTSRRLTGGEKINSSSALK